MARPQRIFYGWVIVTISLVIMTVAYGVFFSWPVFYVAILDDSGWSRAATAIIFSTAAIVYAFASPISGFLFDRIGPRKLFPIAATMIAVGVAGCSQATEIWQLCLFFGFFVGFGTISTGFVPNATMISKWFEKKRGTAIGIAQIGTRDSFVLAPLFQMMILALGWRSSYLVVSALIVITIIPLSQFLRAKPEDIGLVPDGQTAVKDNRDTTPRRMINIILDDNWTSTDWTLSKAIRTYQFFAFLFIMIGAGFSSGALINHFVVFVMDLGFTSMFAANLLLIYAITAMTGRGCGFISDIIGRERTFTFGMAMMLLPLPILFITKDVSALWMLYIFIACFGFGSGLYGPAFAASVADLYQGNRFGTIIGSSNAGFGLGAAIGTWLYGYIFDITGTYTLAIGIVMLAICVMCTAIWVAAPRKVRRVAFTAKEHR